MIWGDRVRLARELRGLTQAQLAAAIGVAQPTLAQYESGQRQVPEHLDEVLALQTGLLPSFFRLGPLPEFPLGSMLFRSGADEGRGRAEAHRQGHLQFALVDAMADRVTQMTMRLPKLSIEATKPGEAANMTRSAMGLSPDTPVRNLLHATEMLGVLILVLPAKTEAANGSASWAGTDYRRPVVVLSADLPGDRQRMTVAHEIGHLVMHRALRGSAREMERDAFAFACELLMPEAAMRLEIVPPVTLPSLADLKPRWGVAIQALARRAHELGIISASQYRYLFEQIGKRGWRTVEPENLAIPVEKPRAVRKMAELLYGKPIDLRRMSADTGIPPRMLESILTSYYAGPIHPASTVPSSATVQPLPFPKRPPAAIAPRRDPGKEAH